MGDTRRDGFFAVFLDDEVFPSFFTTVLSFNAELADDFRFLASILESGGSVDSFCFFDVRGACFLAVNTEVLRFLPLVIVGPARSPVRGSRFSFSVVVAQLAFKGFVERVGDVTIGALGLATSAEGVSWKTVKVRSDI